jgi:DNA topoisomerase-1
MDMSASVATVHKNIASRSVRRIHIAGVRYVDVHHPGISRRWRGGTFAYFHPDGRLVRDKETLIRIRSLAIPSAWQDIWICRGA